MKVQVIGSGDAFGSGGRFNTCLLVAGADGSSFLIDCGATSLVALNRAGIDRNGIAAILFTHFHGDHFGGLPFFVLDAQFASKRQEPLLIVGPKGVEERSRIAMEAAFPGSWTAKRAFSLYFREVEPGRPAEIAGSEITAFAMVHDDKAGPCQGYRVALDGQVFSFSGDTGWCESLLPLAQGADLLLVECYALNRPLPHHLDWRTLAARLPELGAKRVVITHMGADMLAHRDPLLAGSMSVERAADGMVILS